MKVSIAPAQPMPFSAMPNPLNYLSNQAAGLQNQLFSSYLPPVTLSSGQTIYGDLPPGGTLVQGPACDLSTCAAICKHLRFAGGICKIDGDRSCQCF